MKCITLLLLFAGGAAGAAGRWPVPLQTDLTSSKIDVTHANETLHYAWAAYCNQSALEAWSCEWCTGPYGAPKIKLQAYLKDSTDGTQGYVGIDTVGSRIIVSYRGSSDLANDIEDADFKMSDPPFGQAGAGIQVDNGFLQAYLSLRMTTQTAIAEAQKSCKNCTLLFTGHSLGAAMATLGAVDAAEASSSVMLYNFGSPRVGNQQFVSHALSVLLPSIRMRRQLDIVPSIPPRLLGYVHIGTEVWDKHTDGQPESYVTCDGSGEDADCGDSEEWPVFPLYLARLSNAEHTRYMGYQGGGCEGDDS